LEKVCEVIQGQSPPGTSYNTTGHGLPFFQGKAEFGDLYPEAAKWCTAPAKIALRDDVLISIRAPVGPTNLCPARACIGRGLAALRPRHGIPPRYILYALRNNVRELVDHATGSTFEAVSGKQLRAHEIPVAPGSEQHRIVAEIEKQFTRLDAGVASLKRVQAALKRYRASLLKAACEGRLVPTEAELARREGRTYEPASELLLRILKQRRAQWESTQLAKLQATRRVPKDNTWKGKYKEPVWPDVTRVPQLPGGWCWAYLDQLSQFITSGSRGWAEFYSSCGSLFIRAQDIKTDKLKIVDVARVEIPANAEGTRTFVRNYDLLITITGANVTKSALVRGITEDAYVSQHVALVRPVMSELIAATYLWIVSPANGRKQLELWAYGAGKPGLNLEQLRSLHVAVAPAAEQKRIVAEVERRLSMIEELEALVGANLKRAERLRQSILHQAFKGRLLPQVRIEKTMSSSAEQIDPTRARPLTQAERALVPKSPNAKFLAKRRALLDVIREAGPLTSGDLFIKAGFTQDSVDAFYEELRQLVNQKVVREERPRSDTVILKVEP
jgi:type I restriction enzyme S subunit